MTLRLIVNEKLGFSYHALPVTYDNYEPTPYYISFDKSFNRNSYIYLYFCKEELKVFDNNSCYDFLGRSEKFEKQGRL